MSSSKNLVPEAKAALEQFKMEAASEVGVNLTNGYNGDLTSVPGRFVGGQMVNMMTTVRTFSFKRQNRNNDGHSETFTYKARITV